MISYRVTFEDINGNIHTHMCMADGLRTASIVAQRAIDEDDKLKEKEYVIIDISEADEVEIEVEEQLWQ